MKKKVISILAVLAMMALTGCGAKTEVKQTVNSNQNEMEQNIESHQNEVVENIVSEPQKSEKDAVIESLIKGGEWKPAIGYYYDSGENKEIEYTIDSIYGKYAGVGGATFHKDGTFTKFIGVFDAEEEVDKRGTYTINTEEDTITFQFSRGEKVIAQYDDTDEGSVSYFNFPEEAYTVRFEPTNTISLKDYHEEAKYQIELAMKNLIKENYGEDIVDSKIEITKIYSPADEEEIEVLKEMNLGRNEVAFEVKYALKPAEGVDPILLTAATGEYDEETGWVKEKFNLGILRPNENGDGEYHITDFGTGW